MFHIDVACFRMRFTKIFFFLGCVWVNGTLAFEPPSHSWISTVWEILERMILTENSVKGMGENITRSKEDIASILEELRSVNADIQRARDEVASGLKEIKVIRDSIDDRFNVLKHDLTKHLNNTGKL